MPELQTNPVNVIVYPDRARVTRQGSVTLEPGLHQLEAPGLPLNLNPDSLRAAAHGTARARLSGVKLVRTYFVDSPVETIRDLEKRIEGLRDELIALNAKAEVVQKNKASLEAIAGHSEVFATALAASEMSVETQLAIFDGLRLRAEGLNGEIQEIAVNKRDLERQVEKLVKELEGLRASPRHEQYTGVVEIEVLQAGELTVELSYGITGAGWTPLYDLRLQAGDSKKPVLEVSYLAQVTQRTGETWADVSLSLSTARPALMTRLPELNPWYIQPAPVIRAPQGSPAPMAARISAAPAPQEELFDAEADFTVAQVDSSGAAVTYRVPGKVSIPPDGGQHKVAVANLELEPHLDYISAPKLVEAVYRRAQAKNTSPYIFLPGTANLFSGEEFLGSLNLELIAPGEEIELFLGVDDRLQVERELKRREVDKRFIGGKRLVHYGYEISLVNLLPNETEVELRDQMPVSSHEDVKVRLDATTPKVSEQDEMNRLTWRFILTPKEKQLVRYDFSVEYPLEMRLTGLP